MFIALARILLYVIAAFLILFWTISAGVVWVVESIVAHRRGTDAPRFHIPRSTSDEKVGRTGIAFVAVMAVLAVVSGGGSSDGSSHTLASATPVAHAAVATPAAPVAKSTSSAAAKRA